MRRSRIQWAFALWVSMMLAVPAVFPQQPAAPAIKDITALPEGVTGARIKAFIETINAASPERVRHFLNSDCSKEFRETVPADEHIDALLGFNLETGGIDFYSVRSYKPERLGETVVIVKDRILGSWRGISFRFGTAPENLVAGLRMSPARAPAGISEPPLTEKEAIDEIRSLMGRLKAKDWYSGTVLIAKGASVLLTDFAGEACKSYHVPNNLDTKFNLGSMNKMFTSIAIARLVEAGRLSFDDSIAKFIDESWLPKAVTEKITVRHLITHTSGLGSYFNDVYDKSSRALFRKLDDYRPLIKDDKPAFTPGEKFRYSNTGMFLLGVIIEKVSGEDYFNHIRKAIYKPAGMVNSDSYEMDYPVENLAIGYSPAWVSPYKWQNNLYKHVLKGGPAGGGFSTVTDLHRFSLALLSGTLVSKPMLDRMWTDYKGESYGYGFAVAQGPMGKVVGHGGGFPGINSQLDIYVDSDYIVAAMSNYDNGASPLAGKIGKILARVKKQ